MFSPYAGISRLSTNHSKSNGGLTRRRNDATFTSRTKKQIIRLNAFRSVVAALRENGFDNTEPQCFPLRQEIKKAAKPAFLPIQRPFDPSLLLRPSRPDPHKQNIPDRKQQRPGQRHRGARFMMNLKKRPFERVRISLLDIDAETVGKPRVIG